MNIDAAIEHYQDSREKWVDLFTSLSFDAFENMSNGRLAGAYMKMANAHRRFSDEVMEALAVIKEESGYE